MAQFHPKAAADALDWWQDLQPHDQNGRRQRGDPGALARLRRAATVLDAMQEPATHALLRRIRPQDCKEWHLTRTAVVASVLAHIRADSGQIHPAREVGMPGGSDDRPTLSVIRFQRLLAAETNDELLIVFRRLAAIAKHHLSVQHVARSLLSWGDHERTRWTYQYWNVAADVDTPAS